MVHALVVGVPPAVCCLGERQELPPCAVSPREERRGLVVALGLAVHGELVGVAPAVPLRVEAHKAVKEVPGNMRRHRVAQGSMGSHRMGAFHGNGTMKLWVDWTRSLSVHRNDRWIEQ